MCRLLWRLWSPTWDFSSATYELSAGAFDNPDFVDVVIQSYRHRFGCAPGDPALEGIERQLAAQPSIRVPTVVLHGADDGVTPPGGSESHARYFTGPYRRQVVAGAGHNVPQERPADVVAAIQVLLQFS
jgi:pimeloyl-ACP methyl ester carboxylesterase